jgi:hypothetical protein
MATNEDGHYGKYSGNSRHSRVTSHNFAATRRDDQAHMQYLKEDIDYDNKHGHSDIDMTADEKHISKLAGDLKYDDKHHGAARHTTAHSTEEYMARRDEAIKANAGPAQNKELDISLNANRQNSTPENQNPEVKFGGNARYAINPRLAFSANANSQGHFGGGVTGTSRGGGTSYGLDINKTDQGTTLAGKLKIQL